MQQRYHRTHRKAPLEANGNINQNSENGVNHCQGALLYQFLSHLRANEIDLGNPDLVIQWGKCLQYLVADAGFVLVTTGRQANLHVGGGTEILHHTVVNFVTGQRLTHLVQFHRLGKLCHHHSTTGKVESKVQAASEQGNQ